MTVISRIKSAFTHARVNVFLERLEEMSQAFNDAAELAGVERARLLRVALEAKDAAEVANKEQWRFIRIRNNLKSLGDK